MLPPNPNEKLTFDPANLKEIYLAGGCYWGVDAYMERVVGVYATESGFANGHNAGAVTYEEVCTGKTGHTEAVYTQYDVTKISLEQLLEAFFEIIDPTVLNRQANDIGTQYRTGIYFTDPADKAVIEQFVASKQPSYNKPIVTEVLPLANYYPAHEAHQNYLEKNPNGYCHIHF